MRNNLGRRFSGFWAAIFLWGAACSSDGEPTGVALDKFLIREKAQALAAAKIGQAGGILQITAGEYAGTTLDVPAGALAGDAVLSIYPATPVQEEVGYRPVGPAIRLAATVKVLRADALLTLPFTADKVSEPSRKSLALLQQTSEQVTTVPGAAYFDDFARAAVREFSDYGVALDLAILLGDTAGEGEPPRCPALPGAISLQSAISASRLVAQFTLPSTEQVLKARSFGANGCGYSKGWEVSWYSVIGNEQATIQVWPSGVSDPVTATKPACATTLNAFKGSANSTLLSDDLFERLGSTPESLTISIRACTDGVEPSRIRLEMPDANYIEYNGAGDFVQKSF